jgi:glycosyltransferase involved in cell wall biosynthesis
MNDGPAVAADANQAIRFANNPRILALPDLPPSGEPGSSGGRRRILVASHSHPRLTKGGAEISAYSLFQGLRGRAGNTAWFLGCSNKRTETRPGSCITQPFGDAEFIYDPTVDFDYFKFANPDPDFPRALDALIMQLKPDIVHAHHYAIFGLEMFWRIKQIRPRTQVIVTLHEYLAICYNHGQMVKATTNRLCRQESFLDCHTCFPYVPVPDFFLRKQYFLRFLACVDHFIAPSRFLADRYVAWGLPETKISVLENISPGQQEPPALASADLSLPGNRGGKPRLRVGFFGQISPLKGIMVLLHAAKLLSAGRVRGIIFDIFGDYSNQSPEFQEQVIDALNDKNLDKNVIYHGPYENEDVNALMQSVDVVVVPSIWWENSPVVIQEALRNRCPVVCSDIGGMAEKVRPGRDGMHFKVADAASLAILLEDLLTNPETLERLREGMVVPESAEASLQGHVQVYEDVLSRMTVE